MNKLRIVNDYMDEEDSTVGIAAEFSFTLVAENGEILQEVWTNFAWLMAGEWAQDIDTNPPTDLDLETFVDRMRRTAALNDWAFEKPNMAKLKEGEEWSD